MQQEGVGKDSSTIDRPDRQRVVEQLDRILRSPHFARAERLSQFLHFIVERWLDGRESELKEYLVGTEVFQRPPDFDSRTDPIVRTQAHRLRAALKAYYEGEGVADPIRIEIPKGSYVPIARPNQAAPKLQSLETYMSLRRQLRWAIGVVALLLLGLAAIIAYVWRNRQLNPSGDRIEAALHLSPGAWPIPTMGFGAVSPDGRYFVFPDSKPDGSTCLWLRPFAQSKSTPLPGTDGASFPFWSPDSRQIGFFAQQRLKRIVLLSSAVQTISLAPQGRGGTWNEHGQILFVPQTTSPIHIVPATGGSSVPVTTLETGQRENFHRWPWFLPGGRSFLLYVRSLTPGRSGIYFGVLPDSPGRTAKIRLLLPLEGTTAFEYAQAPEGKRGYLVYQQRGAVFSHAFDPQSGGLSGEPQLVASGLTPIGPSAGSFATSGTRLLILGSGMPGSTRLTWLNRHGQPVGTLGEPGDYTGLRISPDGTKVAAAIIDPDYWTNDIAVIDVATGQLRRVTTDPANDGDPVWTPDGKTLFFQSQRFGLPVLYQLNLAAPENAQRVDSSPSVSQFPQDVTKSGLLLYLEDWEETQFDLWVRPIGGKGRPLTNSGGNERFARFSPDGTLVAYTADDSGRDEVYVREMTGSGRVWRVSTNGGSHPRWSGNGRELLFITNATSIASVDISEPSSSSIATRPRVLFQHPDLARKPRIPVWDVSRDGQRFLLAVASGPATPAHPRLILNWSTR